MNLLPEKFTGGLTSFGDAGTVSKRTLLKSQVTHLTIWLGQRHLDNSDLETFYRVSDIQRFKPNVQLVIPEAQTIDDPQTLRRPVTDDLIPHLDQIVNPLAVFIITTPGVAEKPWSSSFCEAIGQYRWQTRNLSDTAVYRIIMQGGFNHERFSSIYKRYYDLYDAEQKPLFWPEEEIAQELGAFFLFFNSDAPTAGCERLVDFMGRILGRDLPGAEFPTYSFDEITKIAWNINRENFNVSLKAGSVPKYPIGPDGRPIFPF